MMAACRPPRWWLAWSPELRRFRRLGNVLRLYDPRAGAVTPVVPALRGQLRTYTDVSAAGQPGAPGQDGNADRVSGAAGAGDPGQPAALRAFLLADLVRRIAERHRLRVSAWHRTGSATGVATAELQAGCDALNIHPAEAAPAPPDPLDIGIGPGPAASPGPDPRWLHGGEVRAAADARACGDGPYPAALAAGGLDPLALRLAFLRQPYREPVTLTWAGLTAADRTLRGWRAQVAGWANSPSKPMCAQYAGDIIDAFDNDLDTPAALRTLAALAADEEIAPGSRFESFAYFDHLVGLDLARDVGR